MLKLKHHFNIAEIRDYPKRFQVDVQLQELVDNVQVPKVTILVEDAINKLAQSELKNFDLDKFVDNVSPNLHRLNRPTNIISCIFSSDSWTKR